MELSKEEPILVCSNILSQEDIQKILQMIDTNDNLIYKHTRGKGKVVYPKNTGAYFGMFGKPLYFRYSHSSFEEYYSLGNSTRQLLIDNMPYSKIISAISNFTNKKVELHSGFNPPGIHIFANYLNKDIIIDIQNWHTDTYRGTFGCAWLIPIELPSTPCGVDYGNNIRYNYSINNLYGWDGELWHTISAMKLKPFERRITIQCFTIEEDGIVKLFW